MFCSSVVCAVLIVASPYPGEVDTTQVYAMDPIVVTGTRVATVRSEIPQGVTVVSREEIATSGESNVLPILSGRVPGLFVTEQGVTGFGVSGAAAGAISIRGIGGMPNTRVLVLIDGHPQFMGIFGHPLPDAYVASDIERVEVIRGPASALYGTGAMGGAINLITRGATGEGFSLDGRVSLGSYDTRKYSGGVGYTHEAFSILGSVNHDRTDGHRSNDSFKITNGYAKAGYDLRPGLRLVGVASLADFNTDDPGLASSPYPDSIPHWVDIQRGEASLTLINTSSRVDGEVKLFTNFGEHRIYDGFHSTDTNLGIMAFQGLQLIRGNTVTLGLDYKRYGGDSENTLSNAEIGDHSVDEIGGYVSIHHRFFTRLVVNAGIRVESHTEFGVEPVPQAGLAFNPSGTVTVKVSAAKGFRSPTIRELYLFASANPDLEPERMWTYQASLLQELLHGTASVELTGFRSEGDNLIQTLGQYPNVKNHNTGEFVHSGFELEARYRPRRRFDCWASYAYLHTEDPILAAPEHHLALGATCAWGIVTVSAHAKHVAGLITKIAQDDVTEQRYTAVDAKVAIRPLRGIQFFVEGSNLLDEEYEITYDYPMQGATVAAGVSLRRQSD
ncbi:TonB-dependent receptor [Candidatus Fermentibacteria bacterium]|nr:TonB-dependent receptor [Candidatus Fermentibacteria bacterium]